MSMTGPMAVVPDSEADIRWRTWQARGAESDRRTATTMRRLMFLMGTGLAVWMFLQLT
jgi:hypothetical protein